MLELPARQGELAQHGNGRLEISGIRVMRSCSLVLSGDHGNWHRIHHYQHTP